MDLIYLHDFLNIDSPKVSRFLLDKALSHIHYQNLIVEIIGESSLNIIKNKRCL